MNNNNNKFRKIIWKSITNKYLINQKLKMNNKSNHNMMKMNNNIAVNPIY